MRIPSFRLPVSTALLVVGLVAVFPAIAPAIYLASYLPPAGAAYVAEEVRIRTPGGPSLAGTLTLPGRGVLRDGRPLRYPAVLLIGAARGLTRDGSSVEDATGFPAHFRPLYELADTVTRRGIAVLRFDARGVGASTGAGDSTTLDDRCEDARAAIAYLRRRAEIDPQRIAIVGVGEGATVVAMIAGVEPGLRAAVLLAAPPDVRRPALASVLVLPGDAAAVAAPAAAEAFVVNSRGRVAEWVSVTLGRAEPGPRPPILKARRRRHR